MWKLCAAGTSSGANRQGGLPSQSARQAKGLRIRSGGAHRPWHPQSARAACRCAHIDRARSRYRRGRHSRQIRSTFRFRSRTTEQLLLRSHRRSRAGPGAAKSLQLSMAERFGCDRRHALEPQPAPRGGKRAGAHRSFHAHSRPRNHNASWGAHALPAATPDRGRGSPCGP